MNNNGGYDLKKIEEVNRYIRDNALRDNIGFLVEEIGDGNMNYVYRIKPASGESFILKYAAGHTRISEDITVSTDRIRIEAEALTYLFTYVPEYIPQLLRYDEVNHCILMKDYKSFLVMRERLLNHVTIPDFAENITNYLVKGLLPSSELVSSKKVMEKLDYKFSNPLCKITETFVFTEPFNLQSSTNAIYGPNREYINCIIFEDQALLSEIGQLKFLFSNKKQALLHGDLHTGSIFTDKSSIIVFDFEFAFIGPIGFDLGSLIANLIFSWLNADASGGKDEHINWLEITIEQTIDLFTSKFIREYKLMNNEESKRETVRIKDYLSEVIRDTASFTGVELIRRIIGIAQVADMLSIHSEEKRIRAERIALRVAKYFIMNKDKLINGSDFVMIMKDEAERQ